jgi:dTDP-glucose 4,6-dehydratase
MRLLVTGGLGFIGVNFIRHWFSGNPDDSIVNIDKMTYAANADGLSDIEGKHDYELVKGDISDPDVVGKAVRDVDAIVNFAAETHVDRAIQDSREFIRSNIVGTYVLLEAARKNGTRFHQISTDEVYGSLGLGSKDRFTETSRYDPRNPYSASKAAADHLARSYSNTYGLPVTISNCSNNFGPYQNMEKLIPKAIMNAMRSTSIPVYGEGLQMRDWIYVEDHCSAIENILKKGNHGETYLVSAGNVKRNIDVVKEILGILGRSEDLIKFVPDRPGHDAKYALDSSKIARELGWKPAYGFEEGMKRTIEFYTKAQAK